MSMATRLWRRRFKLLTGLVLVLVAASVVHLWTKVSRIENALPLDALHKERSFAVLLEEVGRLETELRLGALEIDAARRERLAFALDLLILRQRDNRDLYAGLQLPGVAELHRDLGAALAGVDETLRDPQPDAASLAAWAERFGALRERLRALNGRVFEASIGQAVTQRADLDRLRNTVSAMIVMLGGLGMALGVLLVRQQRNIRELEKRDLALQAAEVAQRELRERLERITDNMPGVIFQYREWPDGHSCFPYASQGLRELFGVSPEAAAADGGVIFSAMHPEDRPRVIELLRESARDMQPRQVEYRVILDGVESWLSSHGTPRREADGSLLWHGYTHDVTRRRLAEDEIKHLAFYDSLTGLPNRRLLMDRLRHALALCARTGAQGALLFIDLDNFKTLNDTRGHDCGDTLLRLVADRLRQSVRLDDTVARLGGDEFVIMLEGLGARPEEAATQAEQIGEKILALLNLPYMVDGQEYHGTPSIGVALFGDRETRVEDLLKRADLAMYQAKGAGRNTLRFFDPAMQTLVAANSALEAEMRQGLRQGEFILHYQPQFDAGGALIGMEALVRWQHPQRGLVPPGEFIALAESTGLILPLGQWVLETACAELAACKPVCGRPLGVAVNVSARQFRHPDFVEAVLGVIERSGIEAAQLKIELTESLLLEDVEETVERIGRLKAHGVGFSLDDFGTGYSSLSYLKRLPLDQIKIDRSFVRDVLSDANDAAIARTVIALGQTLGLHVIAEGVETEAQRDFLIEHGCDAFQGYLFGRPAPIGELRCLGTLH
ncbi:EAL domain-containing protein [Pseudothauera nasutitermitis]|uniref:EAL domain-containing protein n=1 Tax=Pseudothauera nasutitermitis TaxID=2565930 RepID=A0A4S4B5S8_9RHOO|nr:EAL domain-containing protein [Pseudothauera nasutitermitis]THF66327.1 EAL domain-containing protein [Pseudothauera nasutitermitis]